MASRRVAQGTKAVKSTAKVARQIEGLEKGVKTAKAVESIEKGAARATKVEQVAQQTERVEYTTKVGNAEEVAPQIAVYQEDAAKSSATLRTVGTYFESVDDIMANPSSLNLKSYAQVRGILNGSKGWVNDVMNKTRGSDKGWIT